MAKKKEMYGLHIVITGNPVDGLFFYGTFKTGEEAMEWADINQQDKKVLSTPWWTTTYSENL